jgi:hypothetical protein
MRCVVRRALPIVLMLAAAPTASLAQPPVCHAIRRGESATEVARRLTGDGWNAYRASFQIMNAASRFVPKSQYDRIRAGWRACVVDTAAVRRPLDGEPVASDAVAASDRSPRPAVDALASRAVPASAEVLDAGTDGPPAFAWQILHAFAAADLTIVWLSTAMVVPWLGWRVLDGYMARRQTARIVTRHFASRFIHEFERPLLRFHSADHAVRSRIRMGARPGRFDILLAPAEGRRYPNLSDHRKNVEYDVARVLDALGDASFVSGPLHTHADWVVVPFQLKRGPKKTGATCISSL